MATHDGAVDPRWIPAWSRAEGEERAREAMRTLLGVEPDGVWSAPGRLTIIGEYTDFARGLCLPTTIPHRTYVAARLRDDDAVRIASDPTRVPDGEPMGWEGTLDTVAQAGGGAWTGYPAGVLWALQEHGFSGRGLDLAVTSCVPVAAGLSSSAALTAASALAVNDLWRLLLPTGVDAHELAEVCVEAEDQVVGCATAGLDQHAVLRCPDGEALLLDFDATPVTATPCPLYFPEYGLGLLVIDTGMPHEPVGDMIRERIREAGEAAAALGVASLRDLHGDRDAMARVEAMDSELLRRRARHVITENERVELVRDELAGTAPAHERFVSVGKAMFRSHASLEVDLDVSCDGLNLAVDTAFRSGALGARMVGAGRGGSAVALVRRATAASTARAILAEFRAAGRPEPSFVLV